MKRTLLSWALCAALFMQVEAQSNSPRTEIPFDFDWTFHLGELPGAECPDYHSNGERWDSIQLPHDWSIALDFDPKVGGSSGYLPGGIGLYRKRFTLPDSLRERQISIEFDGVYHKATVYLNGQRIGFHLYGYTGFSYDLTPYLNWEGENDLFVHVDHTEESRWYTGSGIYRHVRLVAVPPVHIRHWGEQHWDWSLPGDTSTVSQIVVIENRSSQEVQDLYVTHLLFDPQGHAVAFEADPDTIRFSIPAGSNVEAPGFFLIPNPHLWDVDDPYCYTVVTQIRRGDQILDEVRSTLGLRMFLFDADKGFTLNGRSLKLQGVCLHQDAGCLGVAVPDRAYERRLKILKEFGVNAIRCSHNPPSPEFLNICDTLGFLVIDEAFDKWKSGYYGAYFNDNWKQDLSDMVRRDNNHPSVIVWGIGNELSEAWLSDSVGIRRAQKIHNFVIRVLSAQRPTLLAAQQGFNDGFGGVTDLIGYNYMEQRLLRDHKLHPERKMLVTEAFPYYSGLRVDNVRDYVEYNPWNYVRDNDFIAGAFIWAGVDYIGEASAWPSVGWNSCPFDLTMFEKPAAAYLRSVWQPDKPLLRLMVRDNGLDIAAGKDHWQYPPMAATWNLPYIDGRVVQIRCVTTCDSVRLFAPHWNNPQMDFGFRRTQDYTDNTILWNQPYRPGKVLAIGYKGGVEVCRDSLVTTGEARQLRIENDRPVLNADGQDMAHLRVTLLDAEGHISKMDDHPITVTVEGAGRLLGVDNGDMRRQKSFSGNSIRTYFGTALIRVQAGRQPGVLRIRVQSDVQEERTYEIEVR